MAERPRIKPLVTLLSKAKSIDGRIIKEAPKLTEPFYSSAPWRSLMADILSERGRRCEDPDCPTPKGPWKRIYGDHIAEIKDGGALLDKKNIMLRCPHCHTVKTNVERNKRMSQNYARRT